MIHTEIGRLDELIAVVSQDLMFVQETMGVGPSGNRSRDKVLCADGPRYEKFAQRNRDLIDILGVLRSLK